MAAPETTAAAIQSRQLAELHRDAQERLGIGGAIVAYTGFSGGVNILLPSVDGEWFAKILTVTNALRKLSRRLAGRYYALSRAIETGYTVPDIDGPRSNKRVPMSDLYQQMAEVLQEVVAYQPPAPKASEKTVDLTSEETKDRQVEDDASTPELKEERIADLKHAILDRFTALTPAEASKDWTRLATVDSDWDWPDEADEGDVERELQRMVDDEIQKLKDHTAAQIRKDQDSKAALAKIQDEFDKKAALTGSLTEVSVQDAGRKVISLAGAKDKRRSYWMRITEGKPCAFCAMLASRGAAYKTEESGGFEGHLNCRCSVMQIFISNPVYSQRDRFFIDNWKKQTENAFNKVEKLNAWRRWLSLQYQLGNVPARDSDLVTSNHELSKTA